MDPMMVILWIIIAILVIRYVFFKKMIELETLGILHEAPWPVFGNMTFSLSRRYHFTEVFTKIYRINEDASYVGYYEFSDPVIMIRTPELIKSITTKNFDHFMDHRGFTNPDENSLFTKNLIGLRGEKWRAIRNLLSPAFTSSKMRSMFKLMSACGKNFVDNLADSQLVKSNVLDSKDAFTRYTNDVIATCAFGLSIDSVKNPNNDFYLMGKAATDFTGFKKLLFIIGRYFPGIASFFNLKFVAPEVESFFENVVRDTIETRDREGIERPDMIQLMMESRGKRNADGPDLTIKDMTAQAFIFFFGGFESTATLMCFLAHVIAIHDDVQTKLREEFHRVRQKFNGQVTYEAISEMHYLDAVIAETLRLYPVTPILDRLCVKTFELPPALPDRKPISIQPGQYIIFPAFPMHRDPKYFPDPDKFDPERFMGYRKSDIDPYAYMPFGHGPRMCIGNRFALLETKVLIFHLLEKFQLLPSPTMILPLEFDKSSILMRPKGGFTVKLISVDKSESPNE